MFFMADRDLCVKEVADLLLLSIHTVESYTKSIRKKLGVHNLHAAVYVALRRGWI